MTSLLASMLVLLTGLYLIGLSLVLLLSPARGTRFLSGFAGSAFTHYLELVLRLIAGGAILLYAPQMLFSGFFAIFGGVIVATTVGLFAVPWQWHRRFSQRAVPYATRNSTLLAVASLVLGGLVLASVILGHGAEQWKAQHTYLKEERMELGAFSISLAVKDIGASREFYEKFGFEVFAGNASQNWLILKNGDHAIGLFQGMFEKNILTFNPGWDSNAQGLDSFTDVRELQRQLKAKGMQLQQEADESTTGPASFVAVDPDGNPILVDQHV